MFKPNFTKEGPGVDKRPSEKTGVPLFFELLFRKLWNLCKLNMLYLAISIPFFIVTMIVVGVFIIQTTDVTANIANLKDMADDASKILVWFDFTSRFVFAFLFTIFLGQGPATAGYTYILRNYSREEHAYLFSDFMEHTKKNFRQALLLWMIDLAVFALLVTAFRFYASFGGTLSLIKYVVFSLGIIYMMMHLYVYQVMITFDLPLKAILKNSFIFAGLNIKRNLLLLLITFFIHTAVPYFFTAIHMSMPALTIFLMIELLILPSLSGFMTNFFIHPTIKQIISSQQ